MVAGVKEPRTMNLYIPHRRFTVILLITFEFQHFLTEALHHNPYIIELIPLRISCANKTPLKRRRRLRKVK